MSKPYSHCSGLEDHPMVILEPINDILDIHSGRKLGMSGYGKVKSLKYVSCLEGFDPGRSDEKIIHEELLKHFNLNDFVIIKLWPGMARIYDYLQPRFIPDAFLELEQINEIKNIFKISFDYEEVYSKIIIVFNNQGAKTLVDLSKCFGLFDAAR